MSRVSYFAHLVVPDSLQPLLAAFLTSAAVGVLNHCDAIPSDAVSSAEPCARSQTVPTQNMVRMLLCPVEMLCLAQSLVRMSTAPLLH